MTLYSWVYQCQRPGRVVSEVGKITVLVNFEVHFSSYECLVQNQGRSLMAALLFLGSLGPNFPMGLVDM